MNGRIVDMDQFDIASEDILRSSCDAGPIPANVQQRLDRTYSALKQIPQEKPRKTKRFRTGTVAIAAAAACALFAGAAFATTSLFQMGQGDGQFFASDSELPVYSSLEQGAKSVSATIGQTSSIDGVKVTLDSISCDRNVANLYMTLENGEGFDLAKASNYEGSDESEWSKIQNLIPIMSYSFTTDGGSTCEGDVRRLDAYEQDGAIKCLMRVTPSELMPTQMNLDLTGFGENGEQHMFNVGLDMSDVAEPKNVQDQMMSFDTSQGQKHANIKRFTVSELATVMVVSNEVVATGPENERPDYVMPEDCLTPDQLKITDNAGNILIPVDAGDGNGISDTSDFIVEYANISGDVSELKFTPMLMDENAAKEETRVDIDVAQPDQKIPVTEFGGYEISSWSVKDSTVTFKLTPYGWLSDAVAPELLTDTVIPMLGESWTDPDTGESGVGYHSSIGWTKWDYETGDVLVMHSYYKATDAELEAIHNYYSYVYAPGSFIEDTSATQSITL